MRELGRHVRDHTQIVFGTAVDGKMGNRLSVTIISSLASEDSIAAQDTSPSSEPFLAPPPAILEQVEEQPPAPPAIDIVPETESAASPEAAPDDLIAVEPPVAAEAARAGPIDQKARATLDSAEEKTGCGKRGEATERKIRPGEAGGFAVRTGHARTFRKKRADHRRRSGSRHSYVSPQEHPREVTSLRRCHPERM
jgi:hypothetical protein